MEDDTAMVDCESSPPTDVHHRTVGGVVCESSPPIEATLHTESNRKCICNKESCHQAVQRFKASLPNDHAYQKSGGLVSLATERANPFAVALKLCIAHHLQLPDSAFAVARWYVALWHWPVKLLEGKRYRATPFKSMQEAKDADIDYFGGINSGRRFYDPMNNVHYLLEKARKVHGNFILCANADGTSTEFPLPPPSENHKQCYSQAPVNPLDEAICVVQPFERSRQRRMILPATPAVNRTYAELPDGQPIEPDPCNETLYHLDGIPLTLEELLDVDAAAGNIAFSFSIAVAKRACVQICQRLHYDENVLREDDTFRMILNNLHYNLSCSVVPLADNKTLYICGGLGNRCDDCHRFMIRSRRRSLGPVESPFCFPCSTNQYNENRKEVRQRASTAKGVIRTDHDSRVRLDTLSKEELIERVKSHAKVKRNLLAKLNRLKQQRKKESLTINPSVEAEFISLLKKVFADCSTNGEHFKTTVVQTMVESMASKSGDVQLDSEDLLSINNYASRTLKTFENYARRIRSKHSVRFSPEVIRTALAFWLRSPGTYEELRTHSLEIYPSARTLYRYQSKLISHEGFCPKLYGQYRDERHLHGSVVDGILCFDEMTFTSDIYSNVKNNVTYGFASSDGNFVDKIDLATEIRRYFDESTQPDDDDDDLSFPDIEEDLDTYRHAPAKKVNLFRLKTLSGDASNLEYWYNSGSLSGDTSLTQLLQVLYQCELVGIRIHMICADAGGGNSALYTLLRETKLAKDVLWPDDGSCTFRNPCDPSRRVAIVPCTVHGLKAMRNALLNSTLDGARGFTLMDIFFGWMQKMDVLKNDLPACARSSSLTVENMNPDGHSKMNVWHAMAPFTYKTLIKECCLFAKSLPGYKRFDLVLAERELKTHESTLGYESEKLLNILDLLKNSPAVVNGLTGEQQAALNCLEYSIHVHGIYISRFLNSKACLVRSLKEGQRRVGNPNDQELYVLEEEIDKFKRHLQFFDAWYKETKMRQQRKEPNWARSFLAHETYLNLRQSIWGFFAFAKSILAIEDADGDPKYWNVPYILANQSTVEHIFSIVREANRQESYLFPKAMLACALVAKQNTNAMKKGKSYIPDHITIADTQ